MENQLVNDMETTVYRAKGFGEDSPSFRGFRDHRPNHQLLALTHNV